MIWVTWLIRMAEMTNLTTDLGALHTAIRDRIAEAFPSFATVEFYRDDENENIQTPACILELEDFAPTDEDPGTGEICLSLRFVASLIFTRENGPDAPLQTRLAAAALSAFINKNRFGGRVSPARIIAGSRDDFSPLLSGRLSIWRIEWVHAESFFGDSVWQSDNLVPKVVFLGRAPNIGLDHIGDYEKIWKARE